MISVRQKGNLRRIEKYLKQDYTDTTRKTLKKYGDIGLESLKAATPVRTGLTRDSWEVELKEHKGNFKLSWNNTNLDRDGLPVIVLLEYGHGTTNKGYVPGRNFVRPTIRPILEKIDKIITRNIARNARINGGIEEVNQDA